MKPETRLATMCVLAFVLVVIDWGQDEKNGLSQWQVVGERSEVKSRASCLLVVAGAIEPLHAMAAPLGFLPGRRTVVRYVVEGV